MPVTNPVIIKHIFRIIFIRVIFCFFRRMVEISENPIRPEIRNNIVAMGVRRGKRYPLNNRAERNEINNQPMC